MSGSIYGKLFQVSSWGESHGKAIGVVIDGCPAGLALTEADIQPFLNRRKPGQSRYTTPRKEDDAVEILSGTFEGLDHRRPHFHDRVQQIPAIRRLQRDCQLLPARTCGLYL